MKWRPISEYKTPDEDVLFRIEWEHSSVPYFIIGWIDEDGEIYTHDDPNGIGGYICNVRTLHKRKIKNLYFVDPKEIPL